MWKKICKSEQLPLGSSFYDAEEDIGIYHTEEGLFALEDTCPHYDAALHQGEVRNGHIICPWHRWRFQLDSGACQTGARFDIHSYPVKREDGFIWLDPEGGTTVERAEPEDEDLEF